MSAIGDTRARSLTHPPSEREPPSPARDLLHRVPKLLFTVTETSDPSSGDSVRRIGEAYGHTVFATRNAVTQNPANCSPAEALELRFIRLLIATMLTLTIMSFAPAVQASTDPEATSFNSAGTARLSPHSTTTAIWAASLQLRGNFTISSRILGPCGMVTIPRLRAPTTGPLRDYFGAEFRNRFV